MDDALGLLMVLGEEVVVGQAHEEGTGRDQDHEAAVARVFERVAVHGRQDTREGTRGEWWRFSFR